MIASEHSGSGSTAGPWPGLSAVRVRLGLVGLLLVLATVAWWSTIDRMRGMDDGFATNPGTLGWFLGVWVVMMAAMMLPSIAPTVALYSRMTRSREPLAPLIFTSGYFLTWSAAGVLAFGVAVFLGGIAGEQLAWDRSGRWVAAGILFTAAVYEVTPLKNICLRKCQSPLGFLLGSWRGGRSGALRMGLKHGAWCVGCCWALMAALFAIGVMSLAGMAFIAALIAAEKLLPWHRTVTYGTAATLALLGVLVMVAPHAIPGLTVPGSAPAM